MFTNSLNASTILAMVNTEKDRNAIHDYINGANVRNFILSDINLLLNVVKKLITRNFLSIWDTFYKHALTKISEETMLDIMMGSYTESESPIFDEFLKKYQNAENLAKIIESLNNTPSHNETISTKKEKLLTRLSELDTNLFFKVIATTSVVTDFDVSTFFDFSTTDEEIAQPEKVVKPTAGLREEEEEKNLDRKRKTISKTVEPPKKARTESEITTTSQPDTTTTNRRQQIILTDRILINELLKTFNFKEETQEELINKLEQFAKDLTFENYDEINKACQDLQRLSCFIALKFDTAVASSIMIKKQIQQFTRMIQRGKIATELMKFVWNNNVYIQNYFLGCKFTLIYSENQSETLFLEENICKFQIMHLKRRGLIEIANVIEHNYHPQVLLQPSMINYDDLIKISTQVFKEYQFELMNNTFRENPKYYDCLTATGNTMESVKAIDLQIKIFIQLIKYSAVHNDLINYIWKNNFYIRNHLFGNLLPYLENGQSQTRRLQTDSVLFNMIIGFLARKNLDAIKVEIEEQRSEIEKQRSIETASAPTKTPVKAPTKTSVFAAPNSVQQQPSKTTLYEASSLAVKKI